MPEGINMCLPEKGRLWEVNRKRERAQFGLVTSELPLDIQLTEQVMPLLGINFGI